MNEPNFPNPAKDRKRTYYRRFDHDEARRRYNAGESIPDLAAEYEVHRLAVAFVVTPCSHCGTQGIAGKRLGGPWQWRYLCRPCLRKAVDEARSVRR